MVNKLIAPEGKYYTQKELKDGEAPIFARSIFLGHNDNEYNWRLASQDEKDNFEEDNFQEDNFEEYNFEEDNII